MSTKAAGLWAILLGLLVAAAAFAYEGLGPLPTTGYVALALGIVFSLAIGIGLMTLVFYSSRQGYDEPPRHEE